MKYNPEIHHRKSIRLRHYDYSQSGAYFITMCTHNRECLFGEIIDKEMVLNNFGMIARDEWIKSAAIRFEIELDAFVVMPNHFHGIVMIHRRGERRSPENDLVAQLGMISNINRGDQPVAPTEQRPGPKPKSIGALVAGFKSAVTKHINKISISPGLPVWQRNYYEHIVRDDKELNGFREYIDNNPMNWETDAEFANAVI